ncbi:Beta-hexosaminidase [Candidatus Paraburkholderia kirkii]|nr:Beta-hexosaminidase [Candidatus Paraburkholderia kirkii]
MSGLSASQAAALGSRAAALGLDGAAAPVNGRIVGGALPADIAKGGGYRLTIAPGGVSIEAFDAAGLFYGVQTLLSLTPAGDGSVPAMTIEDAPRYAHRGMMVDVARNFRQPATLRRLIYQMGAYKLNRLHFHLSDDEGWRIEIPGLPELTDIGAKRCHDLTEMRCLLPQLSSVMPEIDMPGHARAAVVSMEARYQRLHSQGDEPAASAYRRSIRRIRRTRPRSSSSIAAAS